ncbi:MAG TPA: YdcF family protein [Lysobacter sp.]|nr:YdcF family protein [Lysobacter sp.]
MGSRLIHRLNLFSDRDVLHAGVVAGLACIASAGLVYLGYFVHVWRVARNAPCEAGQGDCLLLFGKHAPQGEPDREFGERLDRAAALWRARKPRQVVLLGGGPPGVASEAEVARAGLLARGLVEESPWLLEAHSRDTLQNLRNARDLLAALDDRGRVVLLSSRYHLARCALLARQLGLDAEPVAAESRLRYGPRMLLRLAGEAGYVCLTDIGTRWSRLIRSRRMLERVT